jgi:hypothetical protein
MAGFNQRKPVRTRTRSITFSQEQELWLGPSHRGSVFKDDEERQRAWFSNRDRLMELFAHNGYRPMAYWRYESPVPWPGFCLAKSTLWAAGLLGENEARQLEETWRVEFDRSREPNFTFNDGPRGMLSGWAAHVAHLVYCDVPADLAERWAALDDAA